MQEYVVEFENVTFQYVDALKPALVDFNLKVKKGEKLLITGPGGAGKTTVCRCIIGLVPQFFLGDFEGRVTVEGKDVRETSISELSQRAGLIFDDPSGQLVCTSVEDEVAFGPENLGLPVETIKQRVAESLATVRLQGFEKRVPSTLSGGEQQACALAAILAMRPDILVLDEATSNLDPLGTSLVFRCVQDLAKLGVTLIIVDHKIEDVTKMVDRVVVIKEGKIVVEGEPAEVLNDTEFLSKIGLAPPHVTRLASILRKEGIDLSFHGKIPLTLNEAYEDILRFLKKRGRTRKQLPEQVWSKIETGRKPIIEVKDLWYTYPEVGVTALRNVNLTICDGEFVAILGQNGSGKTTLVKHFNGLLKPTRGKVEVLGKDTSQFDVSELARDVGYVFQNPDVQLFNVSVRKEIGYGPRAIGLPEDEIEKRVKEQSERLGLQSFLNIGPGSLDKGARQRVAIASILAMNPKVLVVDEPTTGQDPARSRKIMDLCVSLNKEGKTIIVITHNMELAAEYAHRVILMRNGEVLDDGPTRSIFAKVKTLESTFLRPPQVTLLAQALAGYGIPNDILNVKEMASILIDLIKGE